MIKHIKIPGYAYFITTRLEKELGDYRYSSYRNYYLGDESLIKIDVPI